MLRLTAFMLTIVLGATSCKKDDFKTFNSDAAIYFTRGEIIDYSFSTKSDNLVKDTIYIPLRIIGTASDKDRTFNIEVADSSTAKKGYHFDFGPLVIPANAYSLNLPVYIYRKAGLKDSVVTAHLAIAESADFKLGYSDKYVASDSLNKLHYRININDQLLKPTRWDSYWVNYFGEYSRTKLLFLIQHVGLTDFVSSPYPQNLNFYIQTAKYELYKYELANGILYDENNKRVVFP
ncbi:DUF4843 domain-containing protein [Polluticaenibacter yanchengensis]|uniref:DUF4843 domain-containing protein n=1 Tax=Polluticaenibacter yanchengensis TaxID=3014562 RepID=A0ABT4UP55_9BACT|nr:DUF4843 domain-containing protein [Chitinophagaceae bacterium LY-5]